MATSQSEIKEWVEEAKKDPKVTHVLIVCDTFDYEDYPVEVKEGEDIKEKIKQYSGNMQKIMEIYSMKMDIKKQLGEHRSFHPDHK